MPRKQIQIDDLNFAQLTKAKFRVSRTGSELVLELRRIPAGTRVVFADGTRYRYDQPFWVAFKIAHRPDAFTTNLGALAVGAEPGFLWDRVAPNFWLDHA